MPIFNTIPGKFFKCADGTYSDHDRLGACRWHGGLTDDGVIELTQGEGTAAVFMVDLKEINIAHSLFQNRTTPFSARSVSNIIEAVEQGTFRWENLDPLTLWRNPKDSKLYVLAGHSRNEAFNRLCEMKAVVDGQDFCKIPSKIFEGTEDEAREIALNSNTLSTKETTTERANYYRKMIESGASKSEVRKAAKRLEGRNSNTVLAYAFLNPRGKFFQALESFKSDDTSAKNIRDAARWVGNARSIVPTLTDTHENEIYDWLINDGFYKKLGSEPKFKDELASVLHKRTQFGVLDEFLNFKGIFSRSPIEIQYNAQVDDLTKQIKQLDKEIKAKVKNLTQRKATAADLDRIISPMERQLRNLRVELTTLLQKKDEILDAAKNQGSLFGIGSIGERFNISSGDILHVSCGQPIPFCFHVGIVLYENGEWAVYHHTPSQTNDFGGNCVRELLDDFLSKRELFKVEKAGLTHAKVYKVYDEYIEREWTPGDNCEDFVNLIKIDQRKSINRARLVGAGILGIALTI